MSLQATSSSSAESVLEREYLQVRAKMLELAAFFDRLDRGGGIPETDPRWIRLRGALNVVAGREPHRAERLLLHLSRSYEADWRERFPRTRI